MGTHSEAMAFFAAAVGALPRNLSDRRRGQIMLDTLALAITSGLRFAVGDFEELRDRYRWPWSASWDAVERSYSLACAVSSWHYPQNRSAARSIERAIQRKPFIAPGWRVSPPGNSLQPARVAVGSRILHALGVPNVNPWLMVTSIKTDYLIAVARPQFPDFDVWVTYDADRRPLGCGFTPDEARADAGFFPDGAATFGHRFYHDEVRVVRRLRFTREDLRHGHVQ